MAKREPDDTPDEPVHHAPKALTEADVRRIVEERIIAHDVEHGHLHAHDAVAKLAALKGGA